MTASAPTSKSQSKWMSGIVRRYKEFALISRDPVLFISLIFCGIFLLVLVAFPLYKAIANGFFTKTGEWDLKYFARYLDPEYGPAMRRIFLDTLIMGVLTATCGTVLGFVFAYSVVRCNIPGKRFVHLMAMVPTVSPPFAISLSTILLFGRNGLITKRLLGLQFTPGANDIYGMDGLVLVQVITFFSVAYLILKAMLERLNPALEEAAESLGASRFHLFRTVTLQLLVPGLAGSFLLLFVESLADLGNPLFIAGNVTVLSAQIYMAVIGEYDFQKASALSLVLLIPTLVIFLVQRYYVNRRSYVSVTGKPVGGQITEKDPIIRWLFIVFTYAVCLLIILLYVTIIYGSFSTAWGIDFTPTLRWWEQTLTRGVEAIMDTTFLSALATPFAALLGMVIAFLVVRKQFSGKSALDFGSNLGGAVPGTILGIGFILAFNKPPMVVVVISFVLLVGFYVLSALESNRDRLIVLALGVAAGGLLGTSLLEEQIPLLYYGLGGLYLVMGGLVWFLLKKPGFGKLLMGSGFYLAAFNLIEKVADPIATYSREIPRGFWSNALFQISDHIKVLFQPPAVLMAAVLVLIGVLLVRSKLGRWTLPLAILCLAAPSALMFVGKPLALVGSPYIILAAFVVRSLPASVRSGVAALQQIDPSIEEASNILGADAEYTFRKVTLPLILPALLAGLIFSFTRHMTSLSAIIFLVTARWRVVTASILSEWEQGGVSVAAAYSTVIILFVLVAIGLLNLMTRRMLRGRGDVDINIGV